MPAYLRLENYGLLSPALSSFGEEREKNGAAISLAPARQFPRVTFSGQTFSLRAKSKPCIRIDCITSRPLSVRHHYALMKKLAIIGFTLGLLIAASVLFWHHLKHPSDATIRRTLPGTWVANGGSSTCTRDSDGHFVAQLTGRHVGRLEGTWQVQDGFLIETYTNSSFTKYLPYTMRGRILRLDSHELAVQEDAATISVSRRIEP